MMLLLMASHPGLFITFEGGEGAGKSTQMKRLEKALRKRRVPLKRTLEPGGTGIGRSMRELLLNPKFRQLSPRAELLLYEADRAQHVHEVIRPALLEGKLVLCDRYADSSTVYQGMCRKLGEAWTIRLSDFATAGLWPDLVLLLDIPETAGLERVRRRLQVDPKLLGKRRVVKLDRLEREKMDFHRKVRQGFLKLARRYPRRFHVIDAQKSEEDIAAEILQTVLARLKKKGPAR